MQTRNLERKSDFLGGLPHTLTFRLEQLLKKSNFPATPPPLPQPGAALGASWRPPHLEQVRLINLRVTRCAV